MRIFNENKTKELSESEIDYSIGYLEKDEIIVHIPEQQEIQEQWHYETVKEYQNGGKDVEKVIDVVGQPFVAEHDETEVILIFKHYTKSQLNQNKIAELKQKLAETDYKCLKFVDGELTQAEYAETWQKRKQWREEINKLEKEI